MNKLSQSDFAKLTIKAAAEKIQIQEKLKNGLTVQDLAGSYGVSLSTMKNVLDTLEIVHGRAAGPSVNGVHSPLMQDTLRVLARLAEKAGVDYTEIKPYLVNEK